MRRRRLRVLIAAVLATTMLLPAPVTAQAPSAAGRTHGFDPAAFANPPKDSRPTVLWFWNGTVTDDLIDRQLADLRQRGVQNAVIFPFQTSALKPAFLSAGWFDVVGHALAEAKATGMRVWLFNDDYFPSGRAAGLVASGGTVGGRTYEPHPELTAQTLSRHQRTVTGPATVPLADSGLDVADGRLVVDAASLQGVRVLRQGGDWGDYTITAHRRGQDGAAGIVVRAKDEDDGYLVDTDQDGSVIVYRQVAGAFERIAASPAIPGFDASAEHEIGVDVRADTITTEIDGTRRSSVTDATYATGTVGVRAVATQRSSYDDLRVSAPDGTTLYRQTFDDAAALEDFRPHPGAAPVGASARPAGSADGGGLVDLTATATAGGSWQVPAGTWTIDTFTAAPAGGTYLDLMSDEAVARFMDAVPGEYYRRFPDAFGTVIRGFWDDEPTLTGTPWSPSLPKALKTLGTSPGLALTGVFDDLGRTGRTLRGEYWRAVSDRFAEAYYHQQATWMDRHHVGYISNPLHDEFGPAGQLEVSGNILKDNQWAQAPGTDVVFDQYAQGGRTMLPRWPASVAHQNGQRQVLLENFGAMGWWITPDFMRSLIGAFAVRGISLDVYHAMWTDPANVVYPPPFQSENPWWHDAAQLTAWTGRVMQIARGRARARTALIDPSGAAAAWQHTPQAAGIDTAFTAANDALEDSQVDFDLLDEGALSGDPAVRAPARVRGGALQVGEQRYRFAVLPQTPTLALAAVRTLTGFVRSGGTLVAVGSLPSEETDGHDAELRSALGVLFGAQPSRHEYGAGRAVRIAGTGGLGGATRDVAAATLTPSEPHVRVLRLYSDGDVAFMINNEGGDTVRTSARLPVAGTPQIWDPRTGGTAVAPQFEADGHATTVPLRLDPYETSIVMFRRGTPAAAHLVDGGDRDGLEPGTVQAHGNTVTADVTATVPGDHPLVATAGGRYFARTVRVADPLTPIALGGDWRRTLGPATTTGPLGSWTATDPAYSGSATYGRGVDVTPARLAGHRWTLDLGGVRDVAEVSVNGHAFGPLLWPPYRLDVTAALHAGRNDVAVTVTNTLANAHGDSRPSGLLGPVTLRPSVRSAVALRSAGPQGVVALTVPRTVGVAPGQTVTAAVTVRRFGGGSGPVTVTAAVDGGLSVSPATTAVTVGRNGSVGVPLRVTAPDGARIPSTVTLTAGAGDLREAIPVTVAPATRFGTVTASSTHPGYPAESVIDGDAGSDRWAAGNGWNDDTIDAFPDTLQVALAAPARIGRVDVDTLDSAQYPAARYGLRDADVQALVDGRWRTAGRIRGNEAGHMSVSFDAVTATAVRLSVTASNSGDYSRVVELTAYPG
ncbi:glycosyl hydrolase [Actinomadura sp. DC4]|uniref:glycosyl hydrolase n=1 Tax=Actinomadura sp. DC4 TaxID=3055069 RepID=UPI0025B0223C|nr:glycosyl hydrolase [Actinomadura sp. DC4]MDN3358976.1 glycosyl hydrolase [Actinomadura sp. DC4]